MSRIKYLHIHDKSAEPVLPTSAEPVVRLSTEIPTRDITAQDNLDIFQCDHAIEQI